MAKKKEKLRGFVFFTQDYFGDVAVRLMPGYLRIVWVEAFLLMDQSPRRGVLLKKNGEPYTFDELAHVMNVPIEHIQEAQEWILREGIAGTDRTTRTLVNRRMIRDSKRREINSKNGQKGGNPTLVKQDNVSTLHDSVNRQVNHGLKAKPDPEPDPDPILKDLSLIQDSPLTHIPPNGARVRRPPKVRAVERELPADFEVTPKMQAWFESHDPPFRFSVRLAHEQFIAWAQSNGTRKTNWEATWQNWMLNPRRYEGANGNGNGNGTHKESYAERVARKNREDAVEFDQQLFGATSDSSGDGSHEGAKGALLPGAKGHR